MSEAEFLIARRPLLLLLIAFTCGTQTFTALVMLSHRQPSEMMIVSWLISALLPMLLVAHRPIGPRTDAGLWGMLPLSRFVLDDELTQANRRRAFAAGFVVLLASSFLGVLAAWELIALPNWWPIVALAATSMTVSLRFAQLERLGQ